METAGGVAPSGEKVRSSMKEETKKVVFQKFLLN
jgi:hypothetical protein